VGAARGHGGGQGHHRRGHPVGGGAVPGHRDAEPRRTGRHLSPSEAQLDRFLLKASLGYPDHAATLRILDGAAVPTAQLAPVVTPQTLLDMADLASQVYVNALVLDYLARIVDA